MKRIHDRAGVPDMVGSLDIESLPRGCETRLRLSLVHDALGMPICLPVLVLRGEKPGPVFGVTAAVHGNEINGIPVIHRLFQKLDPRNMRGTVVALPVVNVPGYIRGKRVYPDGNDLNNIMPGRPDGSDAEVFAHRFCEKVLSKFDYLMDLHTASSGRVNSLYIRADMSDERCARMAYLQRPQIILHNPPRDGSLRGEAADRGIPAVTVEIGNPSRFQPEYIRQSLAGLRAVLSDLGLVPKRHRAMGPPPVVCERSYWIYADHGGLLEVFPDVTEWVEQDQVIARLTDIYGDVICEYRAPEAGVIIGKSVLPVGKSGARVIHLGIESEEGKFH